MACNEFIEISTKVLITDFLVFLSVVVLTLAGILESFSDIFEFFHEVRLEHDVVTECFHFQLDGVIPVESLVDDFWVFHLLLKVDAVISVLMATQVGSRGIWVPGEVFVHAQSAGEYCIYDEDGSVIGKVSYRDERVAGQVNPVLKPISHFKEPSTHILTGVADPI